MDDKIDHRHPLAQDDDWDKGHQQVDVPFPMRHFASLSEGVKRKT
jgi:hypothetical protein